jgi:hypothetical protein
MTELVNGNFIEDLSTLLSSCVEGKNHKTFFGIDKEFESMMSVMKSNFVTVWSSLRHALIHKLAHVKSADQASWIKTEDHIAGLLNDDQMLTIENTDKAIKTYENYASRAIETNTTVLLADVSNDDNPEVVALKAQIAEMTVLMDITTPAATTGAAHTGKRARVHKNGKTTVPKTVITCTVCKKNGHDAHCCWFNTENKLKEAAKMKSDAEDILKSKKSNKKAYTAGFPANEPNKECLNCVSLKCYRACAETYDMPSSRFHARSAVLDQAFVPYTTASILDSGAMASIIQGTQGTSSRVQLVGVTGDDIQTETADVTFPVLTATNEFYVIDTTNSQPGSTLLMEKTKDNIISLAVLLNAGFVVDFAVDLMTMASAVFCTRLRVFLSSWSFRIICGISLCGDPPASCLLLLQRSTPRAIRVLLNKASSATAYTILM